MTEAKSPRVYLWALAVYALGLVTVLLLPNAALPGVFVEELAEMGRRAGLPEALLTPTRAEFAANTLVFAPLTGLAALVWRSRSWTEWTTYGFMLSLMVEAVQGLALPGRSASFADVVANTMGALVGAVAVLSMTKGSQD